MSVSRQRMVQGTVKTRSGVVTAMHPRAAQAGAARLAAGGNAVDAFIEAALTVGVAEPFMSGLAGHGSALVRLPSGAVKAVDFLAHAPKLACEPGAAIQPVGPRSVPVPATATGFGLLHTAYGTTARSDLVAAAVTAANAGVPVEGYTAGMILRSAVQLSQDPGGREVFLRFGGFPPRPSMSDSAVGDVLTMPNYAATIAEWGSVGERLLREGWVADSLDKWMVHNGGFVRSADLMNQEPARVTAPSHITFAGYDIHGAPGSSGFPFVAECLGIWSQFDQEPELGSAAYYHQLIETFRVAFEDRLRWLGDPEGGRSPLDSFFHAHLWQLRAGEFRREQRADSVAARDLRQRKMPVLGQPGSADTVNDAGCTTHVNVIDANGMAVSGTFTLGHPFGACVVVPEPGLLLLNTLYQFSREPGHPNELRPGLRPTWNGSPIIVTKDHQLVATLGAPGAARIPTALVQVLLGILRYGLTAQEAIDHPRVHAEGDILDLDDQVPEAVAKGLRRLGQQPRLVRESTVSSNFARPTCLLLAEDGAVVSGLDTWRLATAAGV